MNDKNGKQNVMLWQTILSHPGIHYLSHPFKVRKPFCSPPILKQMLSEIMIYNKINKRKLQKGSKDNLNLCFCSKRGCHSFLLILQGCLSNLFLKFCTCRLHTFWAACFGTSLSLLFGFIFFPKIYHTFSLLE